MSLESATYISDLVSTNPTATDVKSDGDNHIRLVKAAVKATFPNVTGAVTPTHTELNYVDGVTSAIQTQIDTKGAITGQAWSGTHSFAGTSSFAGATSFAVGPTAPTASVGTATTQVATTAFVGAVAMSAALPSQTGNSGKFVTTDGTNASWALPIADQTANSGKYLTTNGTSTSWVAPTGLILLATLTPTAAANVDFLSTFSSTYDDYLVIGDGITVAADDIVKMRLAVAGAADSGSNYFVGASYGGGNVTIGVTAIDASPTTTSAGNGCGFEIQIANANATTGLKMVRSCSVSQINATPGYSSRFTISSYTAANAVSGLRLYCSGGSNFGATGQVRVYGIAKT